MLRLLISDNDAFYFRVPPPPCETAKHTHDSHKILPQTNRARNTYLRPAGPGKFHRGEKFGNLLFKFSSKENRGQ